MPECIDGGFALIESGEGGIRRCLLIVLPSVLLSVEVQQAVTQFASMVRLQWDDGHVGGTNCQASSSWYFRIT